MTNPNQSSTLTRTGVLAAFECAYNMNAGEQYRFAVALSKEIDDMNAAYGGNCALGRKEVERVANSIVR